MPLDFSGVARER